jgi:hypothetical protein
MQARLAAVQKALIFLLGAALLVGILTLPHPANRRYLAALDELSTFQTTFKRTEVEHSLLDFAQRQGALALSTLQEASRGRLVPTLRVESNALPLQPLAALSLADLAAVRGRADDGNTLTIAVVRPDALGAALGWRLARLAPTAPGPWTLLHAELIPAALTQADVDLERDVAQLRLESSDAESAVVDASKKLDIAEQVFETRRKWKLPWKALVKFDEARKTARSTLEEKTHIRNDTRDRYEATVKRAEHARARGAASGVTAFATAELTVAQSGAPIVLSIPVGLELRKVPLPALRGADFPATRAAGLWDEVQSLPVDRAIAVVQRHFNWHYRFIAPFGFKLGGMTVLQFLPCLLPALLVLLVLRMRAVSSSYNPFSMRVDGSLPQVGWKSRVLDCIAVVILPFAAAAGAASALLMIGQVPALPVLSAIASLLLGSYAFSKLGELQNLMEAVVRSHSNPPSESQDDASAPVTPHS